MVRVKKFVKKQLKKGYPIDEIKDFLNKAGYNINEVSIKKNYIWLVVIIVLITIILFYFLK